MIKFHKDMTAPTDANAIFVFGSNLAGQHGGGSARFAYDKYSAVWGVGIGPTGQAYAVPTVDTNIFPLPLEVVDLYVKRFVAYAKKHHDTTFFVTRLGCGIAGFKDHEIANLFANAFIDEFDDAILVNMDFPEEWFPQLGCWLTE